MMPQITSQNTMDDDNSNDATNVDIVKVSGNVKNDVNGKNNMEVEENDMEVKENTAIDEENTAMDEENTAGNKENTAGNEENTAGNEENTAGNKENTAGNEEFPAVSDENNAVVKENNAVGEKKNDMIEENVVEVKENGLARNDVEEQPPSGLSAALGDKDINVFYQEFIAFVTWSKRIHKINSVNLATINSNVKLVNSKCDKILSSGRLKRYNSAIIPLLQTNAEDNCEMQSQNLSAEKTQNDSSVMNIEHVLLTTRKPKQKFDSVSIKRKEHPQEEDEETKDRGRRISKRIRSMDPVEGINDVVEDKENLTDSPREEANIVESNLACLRSESKDFYAMKCESINDFDDILSELFRLGLEAKRIYMKAAKLHLLVPFIGPEIKVMIRQLEDHCSTVIEKNSFISRKQMIRLDEARDLFCLDQEITDCEEGEINNEEIENADNESLESDVNILQNLCELFLQRNHDKDFYTEAKRLCTRSVILSKLAKIRNYNVNWVENVMKELFDKVSEHYLSLAPSREIKYNLITQNKRYKTNAKRLSFYDRFLGSKKLKMPEKNSPKKSLISPIKLQLLPHGSIKKVNFNKKINEENMSELSSNEKIENLLKRYNKLVHTCETFLNSHKLKYERFEKKSFYQKQQVCSQLIEDAQTFERANWSEEDSVRVARMVIQGAKRISGIFFDNEKWFRNYPIQYYKSDDADWEWLQQKKEVKAGFFQFQKNQLKTLVQRFLKQEPGDDFYNQAVLLATETVQLNRRSQEHLPEADDIYKLTLRLYKTISDFYESKATHEQIALNVQAQNKKWDTKRKVLHYYDPDARIAQLSFRAFLTHDNDTKASEPTISINHKEEPQYKIELNKPSRNINSETAKGGSDIRSYFPRTVLTTTQNYNLEKTESVDKMRVSGEHGGWRESGAEGGEGSESEHDAESNHSEYNASEVSEAESSEDEMDELTSEDRSSEKETSDDEDSSENESEDSESSASDTADENDENLRDKKCTVHVSGLSRHHTPLYMRSFLETRNIPVIKCHVLPGPKSADSTISVTVNGIHKKALNKFWGKTFKLTFNIH